MAGRRRSGEGRMDAAVDHFAQMGYDRADVRKIINGLLKNVYGKKGWPFLEDSCYHVVQEVLFEKQEQEEKQQQLLQQQPEEEEAQHALLEDSCYHVVEEAIFEKQEQEEKQQQQQQEEEEEAQHALLEDSCYPVVQEALFEKQEQEEKLQQQQPQEEETQHAILEDSCYPVVQETLFVKQEQEEKLQQQPEEEAQHAQEQEQQEEDDEDQEEKAQHVQEQEQQQEWEEDNEDEGQQHEVVMVGAPSENDMPIMIVHDEVPCETVLAAEQTEKLAPMIIDPPAPEAASPRTAATGSGRTRRPCYGWISESESDSDYEEFLASRNSRCVSHVQDKTFLKGSGSVGGM